MRANLPLHPSSGIQMILGAVMLDDTTATMDVVAEILTPASFFRKAHREIFEKMQQLTAAGVSVDFYTLKDALIKAGTLDDVGGPAQLAALVDGVPKMNVADAAAIVADKAARRNAIRVGHTLLDEAYETGDDTATVVDRAQQGLINLAVRRPGAFVTMSSIVQDDVIPAIERFCQTKSIVSGVPTGLIDLDALTRGFQRGDLVIIGARPAMGTTSLVLGAALHAAMVAEKTVGIFSQEMTKVQRALRAVIAEAQIDGMRLQRGFVHQDEWTRLSAALEIVSSPRLHIEDTPQRTTTDVRALARRLKVEKGLDLLVVDYVQLMKSSTKGENRNLELSEISSGLKAVAKDLQIPVVALSQLSRACEARADKRPMLADLRDSGSLEADADLVIFVYRDEVYNADTKDRGVAELSVAKHRSGPIGTVKVGFEKHQMRFFNLAGDEARRW
jgi:replicative DNA helicase